MGNKMMPFPMDNNFYIFKIGLLGKNYTAAYDSAIEFLNFL